MLQLNKHYIKSFTVIELIIVILIMGILTAVTLPRLEIHNNIKLQGAGKKIISDLRYSQNIAISKHTDTRLIFDPINNIYTAYSWDDSSWQVLKDPYTRQDLFLDLDTSSFSGVSISSADFGGTNTLKYDWQGIPKDINDNILSTAGTIMLNCKGQTATINVTPQTGRITFQ